MISTKRWPAIMNKTRIVRRFHASPLGCIQAATFGGAPIEPEHLATESQQKWLEKRNYPYSGARRHHTPVGPQHRLRSPLTHITRGPAESAGAFCSFVRKSSQGRSARFRHSTGAPGHRGESADSAGSSGRAPRSIRIQASRLLATRAAMGRVAFRFRELQSSRLPAAPPRRCTAISAAIDFFAILLEKLGRKRASGGDSL